MKELWNIKLSNTNSKNDNKIVYDENHQFYDIECNETNINDFIKFIRPNLFFNKIDFNYLRKLNLNEY